MKNMILLLILELCVQDISCNDILLSKFNQNTYKIKDLRVDLMSYNKEYFNIFKIRTFKYNRTTTAVNGTMNMKIAMSGQIEVLVQGYKFLSNEYRDFPVRFLVNAKKALRSNAAGMKAMRNCGNITTFSFEKNVTYHTCNFVMDQSRFPPLIPNGMYKADLTMLYLNKEIAFISSYGEVYTPIAYPKN